MVPTPNQPSDFHWSQAVIYGGHRLQPKWVELVAAEDGEYMAKGEAMEAGVSEHVTGDPLLPTRQRHRDAEVYTLTFAPATEEDRRYWLASGLRSPMVQTCQWTVVHRRKVGTMPWWEAYRLALAGLSDTHMSAAQRRRLDPAFLEPPRKPKVQRTLEF